MTRPIAYLGNDTALTMTKLDREIYVDTRDIVSASHILMRGDWEAWVTAFMQRTLLQRLDDPGALVLDVGANFGWYSLVAYFTREHHYKVLAFEPNPRLAQLLRKTFEVNGMDRRWVHEKAAGAARGVVDLNWCPERSGNGYVGLKPPHNLGPEYDEGLDHTPVALVALDDEVAPGEAVAMIKIDVEFSEPEVIRGAARILEENRDIDLLIESHQTEESRAMLARLQEQGFAIGHIDRDAHAHTKSLDEAMELPDSEMLHVRRG